jgi:RimJ/RimL family protein N-acetyltransferase
MKLPRHVESERLRLRPAMVADAAELFASYTQDPEVTRYLTWAPHESVEDTRNFLERCESVWAKGEAFPWVIERREDGVLLGMIEVIADGARPTCGYVLARAHWGRGYMTEALGVVAECVLAQPGVHRFWAICDVDNPGSARVLEKAGFHREGVLRAFLVLPHAGPDPRNCACYSRLPTD